MLLRKVFLLFMLIVASCGCKKTGNVNDAQIILFEVEYVNYAWGYQHNGFIIDINGNVYTYDKPEGWNFPANDRELGNEEIAENLSKCTLSEYKVPMDELKKYSLYIRNISQSSVSAMKNSGYDMGSLEYVCYQASPSSGMHRRYLIKMEGDFTCENLNIYTKKVASWLKDVSEAIYNANRVK
jgi:hypothetical protein